MVDKIEDFTVNESPAFSGTMDDDDDDDIQWSAFDEESNFTPNFDRKEYYQEFNSSTMTETDHQNAHDIPSHSDDIKGSTSVSYDATVDDIGTNEVEGNTSVSVVDYAEEASSFSSEKTPEHHIRTVGECNSETEYKEVVTNDTTILMEENEVLANFDCRTSVEDRDSKDNSKMTKIYDSFDVLDSIAVRKSISTTTATAEENDAFTSFGSETVGHDEGFGDFSFSAVSKDSDCGDLDTARTVSVSADDFADFGSGSAGDDYREDRSLAIDDHGNFGDFGSSNDFGTVAVSVNDNFTDFGSGSTGADHHEETSLAIGDDGDFCDFNTGNADDGNSFNAFDDVDFGDFDSAADNYSVPVCSSEREFNSLLTVPLKAGDLNSISSTINTIYPSSKFCQGTAGTELNLFSEANHVRNGNESSIWATVAAQKGQVAAAFRGSDSEKSLIRFLGVDMELKPDFSNVTMFIDHKNMPEPLLPVQAEANNVITSTLISSPLSTVVSSSMSENISVAATAPDWNMALLDFDLAPTKIVPVPPTNEFLTSLRCADVSTSSTPEISEQAKATLKALPDLSFMMASILRFPTVSFNSI